MVANAGLTVGRNEVNVALLHGVPGLRILDQISKPETVRATEPSGPMHPILN